MKTFIENTKKLIKQNINIIITIIAIIVILIGIFFLSKLGEDKYFREISYNENTITASSNDFILFVSKEDSDTISSVKELAENESLKFKYIYTENLTEEQKEEILGDNTSTFYYGNEEFNNKLTAASVKQFLIDEEVLEPQYIEITMEDYQELMKEDYFVVVIGKTGCSFCSKYQPVMNKIVEEYDVKMYYVDIAKLTNDDYNTLISTTTYFDENEWGTPLTLVFKNGEYYNAFSGYAEKSTIVNFLESVGAIN